MKRTFIHKKAISILPIGFFAIHIRARSQSLVERSETHHNISGKSSNSPREREAL